MSPSPAAGDGESSVPLNNLSIPFKLPPPIPSLTSSTLSTLLSHKSSMDCAPEYSHLLSLLRKVTQPELVFNLLVCLNGGSLLQDISNRIKCHDQLIHLIFKLDSFAPPKQKGSSAQQRPPSSEFFDDLR